MGLNGIIVNFETVSGLCTWRSKIRWALDVNVGRTNASYGGTVGNKAFWEKVIAFFSKVAMQGLGLEHTRPSSGYLPLFWGLHNHKLKLNSVAIPTERPSHVDKVNVNFC
jgi:hypothetical protein